jgi:glycine/D-amino acid oxidase-like deaminating enzyme
LISGQYSQFSEEAKIDPEETTRALSQSAEELGVDLFGEVNAEGLLVESNQGGRPQDIIPESHSIAVIGVALLRGSIENFPKG